MTIDVVRRPADGGRAARLAAAAETIATRLPARAAAPITTFDFDQRMHVRASTDYHVWVRRNEAIGAWVVGCESRSDGWISGAHRCEGCISVEAALEWGEQLWRAHVGTVRL